MNPLNIEPILDYLLKFVPANTYCQLSSISRIWKIAIYKKYPKYIDSEEEYVEICRNKFIYSLRRGDKEWRSQWIAKGFRELCKVADMAGIKYHLLLLMQMNPDERNFAIKWQKYIGFLQADTHGVCGVSPNETAYVAFQSILSRILPYDADYIFKRSIIRDDVFHLRTITESPHAFIYASHQNDSIWIMNRAIKYDSPKIFNYIVSSTNIRPTLLDYMNIHMIKQKCLDVLIKYKTHENFKTHAMSALVAYYVNISDKQSITNMLDNGELILSGTSLIILFKWPELREAYACEPIDQIIDVLLQQSLSYYQLDIIKAVISHIRELFIKDPTVIRNALQKQSARNIIEKGYELSLEEKVEAYNLFMSLLTLVYIKPDLSNPPDIKSFWAKLTAELLYSNKTYGPKRTALDEIIITPENMATSCWSDIDKKRILIMKAISKGHIHAIRLISKYSSVDEIFINRHVILKQGCLTQDPEYIDAVLELDQKRTKKLRCQHCRKLIAKHINRIKLPYVLANNHIE